MTKASRRRCNACGGKGVRARNEKVGRIDYVAGPKENKAVIYARFSSHSQHRRASRTRCARARRRPRDAAVAQWFRQVSFANLSIAPSDGICYQIRARPPMSLLSSQPSSRFQVPPGAPVTVGHELASTPPASWRPCRRGSWRRPWSASLSRG